MKALKKIRVFMRWAVVLTAAAAIPVLIVGWQPSMSDAYCASVEKIDVEAAPGAKEAQVQSLRVGGKVALGQVSLTFARSDATQSVSSRKAPLPEPGWHTDSVTVPNAMASWEGGLYHFTARPVEQANAAGVVKGFTVAAPMGFLLIVCSLVLFSEFRAWAKSRGGGGQKHAG
jgi:hypothetical protein